MRTTADGLLRQKSSLSLSNPMTGTSRLSEPGRSPVIDVFLGGPKIDLACTSSDH